MFVSSLSLSLHRIFASTLSTTAAEAVPAFLSPLSTQELQENYCFNAVCYKKSAVE